MAATKIEWSDATWNCVIGCTRASSGCDFCYAAKMTRRLEAMGQADYAGLTTPKHFNGVVRCLEHKLEIPLRWKRPRMVFVNSMSDLFHKDVPFEFIAAVFGAMAMCPQHQFQVLTKRPDRMAEFFARFHDGEIDRNYAWWINEACYALTRSEFDTTGIRLRPTGGGGNPPLPLPNVWLGTSVENQAAADERIPHLLRCPAAVRFLSCEPLIGPVDLDSESADGCHAFGCGGGEYCGCGNERGISWCIVGCESGPKRRPMEIEWAADIAEQCRAANVACFIKQLPINGRVSHDPADWIEPLRVRQFPTESR